MASRQRQTRLQNRRIENKTVEQADVPDSTTKAATPHPTLPLLTHFSESDYKLL
jgi:hypothetical protein